MASLNRVFLIGNLGADPEVRYTTGNAAVCNFRIATTEVWNNKDGQRQEHTEWHRIVVWGKQAEYCNEYLRKGRPVHVEGKIRSREWEDKDGHKRWTTEILADRVTFLGSRGDAPSAGGSGNRTYSDNAGTASSGNFDAPSYEPPPIGHDDIPF